jgi:hypothetical protein
MTVVVKYYWLGRYFTVYDVPEDDIQNSRSVISVAKAEQGGDTKVARLRPYERDAIPSLDRPCLKVKQL